MIEIDNLVREMLGVIGYSQQTLRLHPDSSEKIQRYLFSERVRLQGVIDERNDNLDILERIVVY